MEIYEIKNNTMEKLLENKPTMFNVLLMSNRYYLSYIISGNRNLLLKAMNMCITAFNNNASDIDLFFMVAFLYIEINEFKKAEDLIDGLEGNKNYLKANDQQSYVKYMFLSTYILIKKGNFKSVSKLRRVFKIEFNNSLPPYLYTYMAIAELECDNFNEAHDNFLLSFNDNNRQLYLMIGLYNYFSKKQEIFDKNMFYNTLGWALGQGIEIEPLLDNYKTYLEITKNNQISFYFRLYKKYTDDFMLKLLAENCVLLRDKSLESFVCLKEAFTKDILQDDEKAYFIEIAFFNDIRTLDFGLIKWYFEYTQNTNLELNAYLYYLLLSSADNAYFIENSKANIISLALYGLERDIINDYFMTLYAYFIVNHEDYKINTMLVSKTEKIIEPYLFTYEIILKNKLVKNIWLQKKMCNYTKIISVVDEKASINASSDDFIIVFLNKDKNKVLQSEIIIRKNISYGSILLYMYYYKKGIEDEELLFAISEFLLYKENLTSEDLLILEKTSELPTIAEEFKNKIYTICGTTYLKNSKFQEALKFYFKIPESKLDVKYIEPMLLALVKSKEYDSAIMLFTKKKDYISDKGLFHITKEIIKNSPNAEKLSNICYDLIIKEGYYDKLFVELVLKYYTGKLENFILLSKALKDSSEYSKAIDLIILEKSIFYKKITSDIEKIFNNIFEKNYDNQVLRQFVYLLIYNIITSDYKPTNDTIIHLEQLYFIDKSDLLCYALSKVYIEYNLKTIRYMDVLVDAIDYMQINDIFIPSFKACKDKNIITPYIEKNHPFVHRCLPDRNVYLYYKFDGDLEYNKKLMRYVKFGIYTTNLILFFGDKVSYYFSEETFTGTIESKEKILIMDQISATTKENDFYFKINDLLMDAINKNYIEVFNKIEKQISNNKNVKTKFI